MSLVSKLKNILFEEEEIEIPVIEKKEKKPVIDNTPKPVYNEPVKVEKENKIEADEFFNEDFLKEEARKKEEAAIKRDENVVSEREIFKSKKTFNFPAFDEDEFNSIAPKPRTNNVLEVEKRKKDKRRDYKVSLKKEETEEKVKFRPSPIISPVYGILDKNYTPDEITSRAESSNSRILDVDSVRKKAFGTLEEPKKEEIIKEEEIEDKIFEEKLEKARTIDELLKDSSDEVIAIPDEPVIDKVLDDTFSDVETLEDIEPKREESNEDETVESDLFDLIDSMYENREDGE